MVFDMHLNSLWTANVQTLWEDDVHPHYVMRCYAEFTASLILLNVDYGDGFHWKITSRFWTKDRRRSGANLLFLYTYLPSPSNKLDLNLERLRMAIDNLLVRLANLFPKQKLQTVFLINNYNMTIAVLKAEAVLDGVKIRMQFEELLKDNTAIFVLRTQALAQNGQ
ncbi:Hypothetical predicted protein [Olea europaea subsp. europaea]|uniref:Vps52 C-terminal domain-containing protein n=1 Tax=Olea europaea subsp. europaea TaxID=158383 RepID=A0A8S0S5I7_OLEEU|nr:Hypothetical predicted protein [Olea europaea subsp. europaea]